MKIANAAFLFVGYGREETSKSASLRCGRNATYSLFTSAVSSLFIILKWLFMSVLVSADRSARPGRNLSLSAIWQMCWTIAVSSLSRQSKSIALRSWIDRCTSCVEWLVHYSRDYFIYLFMFFKIKIIFFIFRLNFLNISLHITVLGLPTVALVFRSPFHYAQAMIVTLHTRPDHHHHHVVEHPQSVDPVKRTAPVFTVFPAEIERLATSNV